MYTVFPKTDQTLLFATKYPWTSPESPDRIGETIIVKEQKGPDDFVANVHIFIKKG